MIIDPDFFEHWRTRMLADALGGDDRAPLYVMRIWAHCQQRRETRFSMPAGGLRALCRYAGDAEALEHALIDAGFIERDGEAIIVPKWAEHNQKLIKAWENGALGGRPKAARGTEGQPEKTQGKPNGNPTETQREPIRVEVEKNLKPSPLTPQGGGAPIPAAKPHKPEPDPTAIATTQGFDRFWSAWPASTRKVAKAKCLDAWRKAKLEPHADTICAHIRAMRATQSWQTGYEPAPLTYLNQRRWLDEIPPRDLPRPAARKPGASITAKFPAWAFDDNQANALAKALGIAEARPGEQGHDFRSRIRAALERADASLEHEPEPA